MTSLATSRKFLFGALLTSLFFYFSAGARAVTPTFDGPQSGPVNTESEPFTIGTDGTYNGQIQVEISGGGLKERKRFDFTTGQTSQVFTINPTQTGLVTLIASPGGDSKDRRTIYYNVVLIDPSPTPTPTPTPTITSTPTATPTPTPTDTVSPSPTPTSTVTASPTPTQSVNASPTPTSTMTGSASPSPSSTFSSTPSQSPITSSSPSPTSNSSNINDSSESSGNSTGNSTTISSTNTSSNVTGNPSGNNITGANSASAGITSTTLTKPLLGSWRLLSSRGDRNRILYGITQFGPQLIVDFTKDYADKNAILDIRGYRSGLLIYKDFKTLRLNSNGDAVEALVKPLLKRDRIKVTVDEQRVIITTVY